MVDLVSAEPRFYFLGAPSIVRDGESANLSAKAIALLAYVAAHKGFTSRDRLLALLWSDSGDDAGRKNIRNTLWTIRRTFGESVLHAVGDQIELSPSTWVDTLQFDLLSTTDPAAAAALYRGPFLNGFRADSAELEIWIEEERRRLRHVFLRVMRRLAGQARVSADWRALVDTAEQALAQDSLHEPMIRSLMEGLARLGETAEAVRRYDQFSGRLVRELQLAPSLETIRLRDAIARGRIRPAHNQSLDVDLLPSRSMPPEIPFVGRAPERGLHNQALVPVGSGRVGVVLVTGDLGLGKSRLLTEWLTEQAEMLPQIELRAIDATRSVPFGPIVDVLSRPHFLDRLLEGGSPIAPEWLAEVARLTPQIRATRPDLPTAEVRSVDEERGRVFEALARLFLAPKKRPLILILDDAHWSDRSTLEWLRYFVYRARDQAVLVVLAYRDDEAPPSLTNVVASWERDGVALRLPLTRLDDSEAVALLAAIGELDAETSERARLQASGNPYFLIELARSSSPDVPRRLADLVHVRLEQLGLPARQVVQSAAILEPDVDVDLLRRTTGRDEEEILDALDELVRSNALVERPGGFAFAHPLIPTVVRQGLTGPRRVLLSRRAAEALEGARPALVPQYAARLSALHEEGGDPERAARFAQIAAERALDVAAPTEAAALFRRALDLWPTTSRRLELATALFRAADLGAARIVAEMALVEFEQSGQAIGAARAGMILAEISIGSGQFAEFQRWAQRALDVLDHNANAESHGLAHFLGGLVLLTSPNSLTEGGRHLEEARRIASESDLPDIEARVQFAMGNTLAESGDLAGARAAFKSAVELAASSRNHYQEALANNNAGYHAILAGDLDDATSHISKGLALIDSFDLRLPRQYLYSTRGELALAGQQWDDAEEWFNRALVEAKLYDSARQIAVSRANLALVERGRQNLDGARDLMEQAEAEASADGYFHLQIRIDLWLVEIYRQRLEFRRAEEALARAESRLVDGNRQGLLALARSLRDGLLACVVR